MPDSHTNRLSNMEIAVLAGLAKGLHSKEIAAGIRRSKPTVEGYIRTLYAKFGARSRAHLVALAYEKGVLNDELTQRSGE